MKRRYDVYGFRTLGLEQARAVVESVLGIHLQERESSYTGVYYRGVGEWRKVFVLERDEGEYRARLSVNDTADMDAIRDKLTSNRDEPELIRSKTIEVDDNADDAEDEGA